jgi:lysophospholipase L1-like esterase
MGVGDARGSLVIDLADDQALPVIVRRNPLAYNVGLGQSCLMARSSLFCSSCRFLQILAGVLLSSLPVHAQEDDVRRAAVEVVPRGGIPHLLRKAHVQDGGEIRVAYLGGSITAAPGWRVKSLEAFQSRYPAAKWSEIHAAIGGTGSDLGVFRVWQDALAHKPDLLFVEFAVNDGGADPAQIQRAMEGIVRQTWQADPETDIVFVYTLSEPSLADLQAGKASRSTTAMEEVAEHYGIPSVNFGVDVAKRVTEGSLIFKGEAPAKDAPEAQGAAMLFSSDGVHPHVETGHVLYAEALSRAWDEFEGLMESGTLPPHALGDPLRTDHWAAAKLVPITEAMLNGKWTRLDAGEGGDDLAKRFHKVLPQLWRASTPGDMLTFSFRGRVLGFYDVVGPDGGQLRVRLDEGEEKLVVRIDGYGTYHRASKFPVGSELDPGQVHRVVVTLDEAAPDKKTILFEKNRPDLEKNPEKYAPNLWNVGAVMLIGDPVE